MSGAHESLNPTHESLSPTKRPWYGVAYYLLGAQGSFFAWILCLGGILVTSSEAMLFAFNRTARQVGVKEVLSGDPGMHRWVEVQGVEVNLASLATLRSAGVSGVRDTVLLPTDDAAVRALVAARNEVEHLQRSLAGQPKAPDEIRKRLAHVLFDLERRIADGEVALRQALVVVSDVDPAVGAVGGRTFPAGVGKVAVAGSLPVAGRTSAGGGAPVAGGPSGASGARPRLERRGQLESGDGSQGSASRAGGAEADEPSDQGAERTGARFPGGGLAGEGLAGEGGDGEPESGLTELVARWRRQVEQKARRLRVAVRPLVVREGLLTPLPSRRVGTYKGRYGVEVARTALVVGHRPNDLAFWLFSGFATVLFFLVIGLLALRAPKAEPQEEAQEEPQEKSRDPECHAGGDPEGDRA